METNEKIPLAQVQEMLILFMQTHAELAKNPSDKTLQGLIAEQNKKITAARNQFPNAAEYHTMAVVSAVQEYRRRNNIKSY